jgi:hypothetical protein
MGALLTIIISWRTVSRSPFWVNKTNESDVVENALTVGKLSRSKEDARLGLVSTVAASALGLISRAR